MMTNQSLLVVITVKERERVNSMAAKQSQEMKDALALVRSGIPVRKAAEVSGVWFTSLYAAMKKQDVQQPTKKKKNKG